jgi:DMSO/TMAO reductase YedYZ molybdopterin-dependent catalytic subunit
MANREYAMPNGLFFVRSHTSSPLVDAKTWTLGIEGPGVARPFQLTYDELLKLPTHTVTRYVECAGNGRSFFDTLMKNPAQGGQWRLGAYGIAEWTGVRLRDILNTAGISGSAVDVMPAGMDSTKVERPMPVDKAMQDDTLVAYMMNSDIIPIDHGFPARVLAPGWVGINSIKWVNRITVSTEPIRTEKNTTNYVLIGPDYQAQPPALGPAVSTQVIKGAVCLPWPATLKPGSQKITGYAWSPFGKISKVDVSLDGGRTFQSASLAGPNIEAAGARWEFTFNATPEIASITPRATDEAGNTQIEVSQQKWNQLGYLFGAMVPHPVEIKD